MRARLLACLLSLAATNVAAADPITVFGAASLTDALTEAGAAYEAETGQALRFSFAASSTLARQIEAGAPADLFASANRRWIDRLAARGLIDARHRAEPITNRLVVVAPAASGSHADRPLAAILTGTEGHIAIGDPDHVPAGLYARAALENLGLWSRLAPRLARADNTRAALALVARGEAPLGIVYATDAAVTERVRVLAVFPKTSHPPIRYPFAIVAGRARVRVQRLFAWLTGPHARPIFRRHGFRPVCAPC